MQPSHAFYPLENTIQDYEWGTKGVLDKLLGIANPDNKPQAEIWMGAHPKAPSMVIDGDTKTPLNEWIKNADAETLGPWASKFDNLPFLFKILSASKALSVQVHPTIEQAKEGYDLEEKAGIPLSAPHRNYKDANHKPELICALTQFAAMVGFRPLDQIVANLTQLEGKWVDIANDLKEGGEKALQDFYLDLLRLDKEEAKKIADELKSKAAKLAKDEKEQSGSYLPPFTEVGIMAEAYPEDAAIISPLLFNLIMLDPGQALFLDAGTPHAYLRGTGVEIMANSDNVLRGGLTPKHIDLVELERTLKVECSERQPLNPLQISDQLVEYRVPVPDFYLRIATLNHQGVVVNAEELNLLFVLEGEVSVKRGEEIIRLAQAESLLVPGGKEALHITGDAKVAIAKAGDFK